MRTRDGARLWRGLRCLGLSAAAVCAAACAATRPAPSAPTELEAVPLPAPIASPTSVACRFDAPAWTPAPEDVFDVELHTGGRPFAQAAGAATTMAVPEGPADRGAYLEIADDQLALRGVAEPDRVPLRARAPSFVMGDFAMPGPRANLGILHGHEGALDIALQADPDRGFVPTHAVVAQRRCADLELPNDRLAEPSAYASPARAARGRATLARGPIQLASEPGGEPVALLAPAANTVVSVIEQRGSRARIAWESASQVLFGWVDASAFAPGPDRPSHWLPTIGGALRYGRVPADTSARCTHDVPLIAEVDGQRATVGAIRARTDIDVVERAEPLSRVSVTPHAIALASEARFYVRTTDLFGCMR